MQCSKCSEPGVIKQSSQILCKNHFLAYFEIKVVKTIKKYGLIEKNDKICVAASGGKDSLAALYVTRKFCLEHNITFFALAIDEGIKGYRDHTLDDLKKFCKAHK